MKKIILAISLVFIITGCSMLNNNPINVVEDFLYKYQTLDEDVVDELNKSLKDEYTDEQKELYKDVMKEQYKTLSYKVKDDIIDGNKAIVKVSVEVLDYYKVIKEANKYFQTHKEEFLKDGDYIVKLNDYKLEKLKNAKDKIEYTIEFNLIFNNNKWELTDIDDTILNKISGVYEY